MRRFLAALICLTAFLVAGCSSLPSGSTTSAPTAFEQVQSQQDQSVDQATLDAITPTNVQPVIVAPENLIVSDASDPNFYAQPPPTVTDIDAPDYVEQGIKLALLGDECNVEHITCVLSSKKADCIFNGPAWSLNSATGTFLPNSLCPPITYSATSLRTLFNSAGLWDYGPNNVQIQSGDLTNVNWNPNYATITGGILAPDGSTKAATITEDGTNNIHGYYPSSPIPSLANGIIEYSVYLAAGTRRYVQAGFATGGSAVWITVDTQTWTLSQNVTATGVGSRALGQFSPVFIGTFGGKDFYRVGVIGSINATTYYDSTAGSNSATPASFQPSYSGSSSWISWGQQGTSHLAIPSTLTPYFATTSTAYFGPRQDFNPATLADNGFPPEPASTNLALWSRDLTNAAWTVSALSSTAKNQTGIDGVANSASSFTAGAAAATVSQIVTHISSTDNYAVWLKGITLTGAVSITLDGVTYTDVTAQINLSTWSRVTINQATVVNPAFGIKLANSGDKIAVDQNQLEIGAAFASSDIVTTTAAVSRTADVASLTLPANLSGSGPISGTFQGITASGIGSNIQIAFQNDSGNANNRVRGYKDTNGHFKVLFTSGGADQATLDLGALGNNTQFAVAWSAIAGRFSASLNGGTIVTGSGTQPTGLTTKRLGSDSSSALQFAGHRQRDKDYAANINVQQKSVVGAN
jgi:hypothetical protein